MLPELLSQKKVTEKIVGETYPRQMSVFGEDIADRDFRASSARLGSLSGGLDLRTSLPGIRNDGR